MKRFPLKFGSKNRVGGADAWIRVAGGYHPDTIVAQAGQPLRITFHREDESPCSERVVFPDFDVAATLPQHQEVTVELLPEDAGEYGFECGMGMLRGRLIVAPPPEQIRSLSPRELSG